MLAKCCFNFTLCICRFESSTPASWLHISVRIPRSMPKWAVGSGCCRCPASWNMHDNASWRRFYNHADQLEETYSTPLQNDKKKFLKKQSEFVYENYICLFCEKQSLFVAWNWVCRPSREDQLKRNSFCLRQITQDSRMILHRAGKVQTPLFTRFVPWFSPVYKALITQLVKISQPSLNLFKLGGAI